MEQDSFPLRQTQNITHNLHMDGLGTHTWEWKRKRVGAWI